MDNYCSFQQLVILGFRLLTEKKTVRFRKLYNRNFFMILYEGIDTIQEKYKEHIVQFY